MFLAASRGRSQRTEVKPNVDQQVHHHLRVDMFLALCREINMSDDDADQA